MAHVAGGVLRGQVDEEAAEGGLHVGGLAVHGRRQVELRVRVDGAGLELGRGQRGGGAEEERGGCGEGLEEHGEGWGVGLVGFDWVGLRIKVGKVG